MGNIRSTATRLCTTVLDTILPPRCIVTGNPVIEQGTIDASFWSQLNFLRDPCCKRCGYPFSHEIHKDMLCPSCLIAPPQYDRHRAALAYDDHSKRLILPFKHGDRTYMTPTLGQWMMLAGRTLLDETDIILPVPLHRRRLFARRYNQAALLAQYIAKKAQLPHIPDGLLRSRATASQGFMKKEDRRRNVKNAFVLHPRHSSILENKKILLIDDVYTTGSTVEECTKALHKGGVTCVNVLTLARVIKGEK